MYEPLTKIGQVILPLEQKGDILTSINVFSAYKSHRRKMDASLSDDRQLVTGLVLMLCGPPGTGKTVALPARSSWVVCGCVCRRVLILCVVQMMVNAAVNSLGKKVLLVDMQKLSSTEGNAVAELFQVGRV